MFAAPSKEEGNRTLRRKKRVEKKMVMEMQQDEVCVRVCVRARVCVCLFLG